MGAWEELYGAIMGTMLSWGVLTAMPGYQGFFAAFCLGASLAGFGFLIGRIAAGVKS